MSPRCSDDLASRLGVGAILGDRRGDIDDNQKRTGDQMKYAVGDTVQIRVCGFNGLVISAKSEGVMPTYRVSYPDEHGLPMDRFFVEMELEDPRDEGFGFGRKE